MKFKALILSAMLAVGSVTPSIPTTGGSSSTHVTGNHWASANQAPVAQATTCGPLSEGDTTVLTRTPHGLFWTGSGNANEEDTQVGFVLEAFNIGTASWTSTQNYTTGAPLLYMFAVDPEGDYFLVEDQFRDALFIEPTVGKNILRWNFIAGAYKQNLQPGTRIVALAFNDGDNPVDWADTASNIVVNNRIPALLSGVDSTCDFNF